MSDHFGTKGCYLFWAINILFQYEMIFSGFGMAVFRLICFHYLFKRNIQTKVIVRNILIAELALAFVLLFTTYMGVSMQGWEKAILFQFCMDFKIDSGDTNSGDVVHDEFTKALRVGPLAACQILIVGELLIYLWILCHLFKHDKEQLKEGIITKYMKEERNQKNVVTLFGQASSFLIELIISIYTIVHVSNSKLADPSVMPISVICGFTIIAITQFLTSHEMKRFVRNEWNLH